MTKAVVKKSTGKRLLKADEFERIVIRIECFPNRKLITSVDDDAMITLRANNFFDPKVVMLLRKSSLLTESNRGLLKFSEGGKGLQAFFKRTEESINLFYRELTRKYLQM